MGDHSCSLSQNSASYQQIARNVRGMDIDEIRAVCFWWHARFGENEIKRLPTNELVAWLYVDDCSDLRIRQHYQQLSYEQHSDFKEPRETSWETWHGTMRHGPARKAEHTSHPPYSIINSDQENLRHRNSANRKHIYASKKCSRDCTCHQHARGEQIISIHIRSPPPNVEKLSSPCFSARSKKTLKHHFISLSQVGSVSYTHLTLPTKRIV